MAPSPRATPPGLKPAALRVDAGIFSEGAIPQVQCWVRGLLVQGLIEVFDLFCVVVLEGIEREVEEVLDLYDRLVAQ